MSFLTSRQRQAIVAGNAGAQEHCPAHSHAKNARERGPRHGHVFDINKHRDSHIQATIGRAGSVTISNHKFLTHSPKAGGFLFGSWLLLLASS
jgi:hypothetical protein